MRAPGDPNKTINLQLLVKSVFFFLFVFSSCDHHFFFPPPFRPSVRSFLRETKSSCPVGGSPRARWHSPTASLPPPSPRAPRALVTTEKVLVSSRRCNIIFRSPEECATYVLRRIRGPSDERGDEIAATVVARIDVARLGFSPFHLFRSNFSRPLPVGGVGPATAKGGGGENGARRCRIHVPFAHSDGDSPHRPPPPSLSHHSPPLPGGGPGRGERKRERKDETARGLR